MKVMKKLLLVLLAASVCFNVFFIGAYMKSRATWNAMKTPEGRMRFIARQLDLTPAQEEEMIRLRMQLRADVQKYKDARSADTDAFWAEMVKDEPDTARIDSLLEASSDRREETALLVKCIREIMATLTPEQRIAFARMLRDKNYFGAN